jgi:plasmid stability protein
VGQVLIRQIPDETIVRLKAKAARHGRSLEAELRAILEHSVAEPKEELMRLRDALGGKRLPDSSDLVRER